MASSSVSSRLISASSVVLSKPIRVYGHNTYTISSDFINWGDFNYSISDIANTFGHRANGMGDRVFRCGDDKITVFDFGLLFTVFTSMTMAQAELGGAFPIEEVVPSRNELKAVWIGNDLIVYSHSNNLIIPVPNSVVETCCSGKKAEVGNFCSQATYEVTRERMDLFLVNKAKKELLCRVRIAECCQKTYTPYFKTEADNAEKQKENWDTSSALGQLVIEADSSLPAKEAFARYSAQGMAASVAARDDLIITPDEPYEDLTVKSNLEKFFGTVCYTDKCDVVVAVNYHNGLFVFNSCFPGDYYEGIQVDGNTDITKYYNVTDGCERIMRFANTVVTRPLTAAQLDMKMFNNISSALLNMELPRIPFTSCLGRMVIPESTLMDAFKEGLGADLFCIVPVGVIGEAVITITSEGNLATVFPKEWSTTEAFYDITEVVRNAKH